MKRLKNETNFFRELFAIAFRCHFKLFIDSSFDAGVKDFRIYSGQAPNALDSGLSSGSRFFEIPGFIIGTINLERRGGLKLLVVAEFASLPL